MIISRLARRLPSNYQSFNKINQTTKLLYTQPCYYFSDKQDKKPENKSKLASQISLSDIWETISMWG